jgi:predicted Zn finger-like uncharacterized protein
MPLSVTCPQCRTSYNVADHLGGKRVHCQHCRTVFLVPEPPAARWEQIVSDEVAAQSPPPAPASSRPPVLPPIAIPPPSAPRTVDQRPPRPIKTPPPAGNTGATRFIGGLIAVIVMVALNVWRQSDRPSYEPIQIPRPAFQQPIFVPHPDWNRDPFVRPEGFPGKQANPWPDPNVIPGWKPGGNSNVDPFLPDPLPIFDPNAQPAVPRNEAERPDKP